MKKKVFDPWLIVIYLFLTALGIIFVYSSTYQFSLNRSGDPYLLFFRHLGGIGLGLGFLVIVLITPLDYLRKKLPLLSLLTLILLILALIPGIGRELGGARRWINLVFFSLQPSELAKITVIFYLASVMEKKQPYIKDFLRGTLIPFLICVVFAGIILFQKDFSTSMIIMVLAFVMLYVGGAKFAHLLIAFFSSIPVFLPFVLTSGYRMSRIQMLFNLEKDPSSSYQLFQSLEAFKRGGFLGEGLGRGVKNIPYAFNDFIFAVAGEETGFMGGILVLFLFFFLWQRGLILAKSFPEKSFQSNLAFGLTFFLVFQALLNIAVSLAMIFPTGITMPLVSYGRTSFLVCSIAFGILIKLSAKQNKDLSTF